MHASEMAVSHTGFGQTANEARMPVNSGFVSLVSPPVRAGGGYGLDRVQGDACAERRLALARLRGDAAAFLGLIRLAGVMR